jgi:carboxymethylenebutenolidase
MLATLRPVDACVIYYGVGDADVSKLRGPVLGHYGALDGWASPAAGGAIEEKIRAAGKVAEFYYYESADHAFFNDGRPEVYKADAAKLSWDRTLAFYGKHLS